MRAVVQRVARASVSTADKEPQSIGRGLVVLLGVGDGDTDEDAYYVAEKVAHLRIFPDDAGKMNRSVLDVGGEVLAVSQFTLYGDVRRGRRPSFISAAPPQEADRLYEHFVATLRGLGLTVKTGWFQADMLVELQNDGPVTILIDSRKEF